jgi:hypothetical protein
VRHVTRDTLLVLVEQSALFAMKRTSRRVLTAVMLRQWLALCIHRARSLFYVALA